MKKKFFVLAAVITCGQLQAQQSDSTNQLLDEVSVTATRFPKKLSETGKVVNIITRADLDHAGGKDISTLLNEQAGIIINGAGSNPGKDKSVYLRGASGANTLILINGVPVNDPTGVGGAFDLRMLPIEQVERIEILKGAQSTLYGSEAVAGVINIITRKGGTRPLNLYGGISGGNYGTFKGHAGARGGYKGSSYNITYTHNESNGVAEGRDTAAVKSFPKNGYHQNAISADLDIRITPGLHLKPFYRRSFFAGSFSDGAFAPGSNQFKSSYQTIGAQAQYTLAGNGSITGLFSSDRIERSYASAFGTMPYDGNKQTAELFGQYNVGRYVQLLGGVRYDDQEMKNPSNTVASRSIHILSPYASAYLRNLGGFNLELGGRYNDHSTYGGNWTYSINPSYLLNRQVKIFANYGTAFKAPALSQLFGEYGANPDLRPEKSNTLEGGIQLSLLQEKLSLRAVAFRRKISNVIVYGAAYENYDRQKDHGFEIEPALLISKNLAVKLSYAYVDGEVTTSLLPGKDTTYGNLIRRPKHSFGANIGYQVLPAFFVSSNLKTFGKRDDLYFDPVSFASVPVKLSSYSLWDVYAEYALLHQKLKIFGQVNNILDQDYYEVYGYTTLGRNYTVGLRINW